MGIFNHRRILFSAAAVIAALLTASPITANQPEGSNDLPHIVVIVIDTLRADRLSAYGNPRPTSPHIDALLSKGVRFDRARTVEPLTGPAVASMLTALYPHQHGTTRNGIPIRQGLPSLPRVLALDGYTTGAFLSNWTLADDQSGLAEHFDHFEEVLTRKRWFIWRSEATAQDVTSRALDWLDNEKPQQDGPVFLWAHYVEPHAPYLLQKEFADQIGVPADGSATLVQRYDTEIAFVDHWVGELLDGLKDQLDTDNTLFIFASDHGEALDEHGYKGHGKHLYEEELRIPLGIIWNGRIRPGTFEAPASLIDVSSTILGLVGRQSPKGWHGFDWSDSLRTGTDGATDRVTYHQAHKGAVQKVQNADKARRNGLLELGVIEGERKTILNLRNGSVSIIELPQTGDEFLRYAGTEKHPLVAPVGGTLPRLLREWKKQVEQGLIDPNLSPPPTLDSEAMQKMRSLGYIN